MVTRKRKHKPQKKRKTLVGRSRFKRNWSYLLLAAAVLAAGITGWLLSRRTGRTADDPLYQEQKNLADIKIEAAWKKGYTGKGVRIALIDSGVAPHEDLDLEHMEGRDYTSEKEGNYTDRLGHGTFIAGMLSAKRNNGRGMAGMTKSTLVALKVVSDEQPDISLEKVAQAVLDADKIYHCDLISISMGTPNDHEVLRKAIDQVVQKGVIVVAAAGGTKEQVYYPAGYDNVIGVGSVDDQLSGIPDGPQNESVFITAPGTKLIGLGGLGGYERGGTGSSYATAHVAAMAAFAKQHDRKISAGEFKQLLEKTAADKGEIGYDPVYGWGVIDISRFIKALEGN